MLMELDAVKDLLGGLRAKAYWKILSGVDCKSNLNLFDVLIVTWQLSRI